MMEPLIVYASEDCMGWEELNQVLSKFRTVDGAPEVVVKDPDKNQEEFRKHNLVICPSLVFDNELIVAGIPTLSELKRKVIEYADGEELNS